VASREGCGGGPVVETLAQPSPAPDPGRVGRVGGRLVSHPPSGRAQAPHQVHVLTEAQHLVEAADVDEGPGSDRQHGARHVRHRRARVGPVRHPALESSGDRAVSYRASAAGVPAPGGDLTRGAAAASPGSAKWPRSVSSHPLSGAQPASTKTRTSAWPSVSSAPVFRAAAGPPGVSRRTVASSTGTTDPSSTTTTRVVGVVDESAALVTASPPASSRTGTTMATTGGVPAGGVGGTGTARPASASRAARSPPARPGPTGWPDSHPATRSAPAGVSFRTRTGAPPMSTDGRGRRTSGEKRRVKSAGSGIGRSAGAMAAPQRAVMPASTGSTAPVIPLLWGPHNQVIRAAGSAGERRRRSM